MVDPYALGWIICSIITIVAFYSFVFSRKNCSQRTTENITTATGECRSFNPDGDADVIIVGAGVAGSALAYTLGKVFSFQYLVNLCSQIMEIVLVDNSFTVEKYLTEVSFSNIKFLYDFVVKVCE